MFNQKYSSYKRQVYNVNDEIVVVVCEVHRACKSSSCGRFTNKTPDKSSNCRKYSCYYSLYLIIPKTKQIPYSP